MERYTWDGAQHRGVASRSVRALGPWCAVCCVLSVLSWSCGDARCPETGDNDFVVVPAGRYLVGEPEPRCYDCSLQYEDVAVQTFAIQRYEVSQQEYELCHEQGACRPALCEWSPSGMPWLPVVCVNYYMAETYCEWLGGRLCSEQEWEAAARGPKGSTYPWGDGEPACEFIEFYECSASGEFLAGCVSEGGRGGRDRSWVGALNLAGNVVEWTSGRRNAEGGDRFVERGGSFGRPAYMLRSARRSATSPDTVSFDLGIRCCRD